MDTQASSWEEKKKNFSPHNNGPDDKPRVKFSSMDLYPNLRTKAEISPGLPWKVMNTSSDQAVYGPIAFCFFLSHRPSASKNPVEFCFCFACTNRWIKQD